MMRKPETVPRPGYVVASERLVVGDEWTTRQVDDVWVASRGGIECYVAEHGAITAILIGYVLDSLDPERSDVEILDSVVAQLAKGARVQDVTSTLGGRWVLVTGDGTTWRVHHDAGGLRQVFYGVTPSCWVVASQPQLVAAQLDSEVDRHAQAFQESDAFLQMPGGAWWPGDRTLFRGVNRLLPNHHLDVRAGRSVRHWPARSLRSCDLAAARPSIAQQLVNLMSAADRRFPLTLLVTAGRDSRVLLAAARAAQLDLRYVSIEMTGRDPVDADVAGAMLAGLGLDHQRVVAAPAPAHDFWRAYAEGIDTPHTPYAANAEALARAVPRDGVGVTGHMAGVIKTQYRGSRWIRQMNARRASLETGTRGHPFAVEAYGRWLEGVPSTTVPIGDLLYWEHRGGSWLGGWLAEYDAIWRDAIVPFNCHDLLTRGLAVPERHRRAPGYRLWTELIEQLAPELLSWPFRQEDRPRRGIIARARRTAGFIRAR